MLVTFINKCFSFECLKKLKRNKGFFGLNCIFLASFATELGNKPFTDLYL